MIFIVDGDSCTRISEKILNWTRFCALRRRIRPSFAFFDPRFQIAGHDAMVRIAQNAKNSRLSEVIFAWMAPANILSARAVVKGYLEITSARLPAL